MKSIELRPVLIALTVFVGLILLRLLPGAPAAHAQAPATDTGNGRYQLAISPPAYGDNISSPRQLFMIDTRTGKVWVHDYSIDPKTKKVTEFWRSLGSPVSK